MTNKVIDSEECPALLNVAHNWFITGKKSSKSFDFVLSDTLWWSGW